MLGGGMAGAGAGWDGARARPPPPPPPLPPPPVPSVPRCRPLRDPLVRLPSPRPRSCALRALPWGRGSPPGVLFPRTTPDRSGGPGMRKRLPPFAPFASASGVCGRREPATCRISDPPPLPRPSPPARVFPPPSRRWRGLLLKPALRRDCGGRGRGRGGRARHWGDVPSRCKAEVWDLSARV